MTDRPARSRAAAPLRLLAEDEGDLAVISAALQDAAGRVADIRFDPAAATLTLALNRYRWEAPARAKERVRTAVQFGGVLGVRARGLTPGAKEAVVSVLSVGFQPGEAPGGAVTIRFAGGADLQAEVEVLDAALADVGEAYPARAAPRHA